MFNINQCDTHEIWISTADKHFCSHWLSDREGERHFDRFNWDICTVLFMFFFIPPSKSKHNLAALFIIKHIIKNIQGLNLRPKNLGRTCGSAACCVRWTKTGPPSPTFPLSRVKMKPHFLTCSFLPCDFAVHSCGRC